MKPRAFTIPVSYPQQVPRLHPLTIGVIAMAACVFRTGDVPDGATMCSNSGGTPVYVEFRVGDYQYELGIVDSRFAPHGRPGLAGVR
jgi:hypothetical protein